MRIYDNGIYRDETAEEKALRESGVGENIVSINERVDTLEQIQSPEFVNSVTLYANNWTGDASPYSQVVHIEGTTDHSKVDLQPDTEQLSIFHEKDLAFVAENEDGVITVFCVGQKPVNDYTIQATITEVIVNG